MIFDKFSPSEEDHRLWMRVLLEHNSEERTAGGEDKLVGLHRLPLAYLHVIKYRTWDVHLGIKH